MGEPDIRKTDFLNQCINSDLKRYNSGTSNGEEKPKGQK
jgi:hypothetical protein